MSDGTLLEAFAVSHGKTSAYLPFLDLLLGYFGVAAEDDPPTRRNKISSKLANLDPSLEETSRYLFGMLGVLEADDPLVQMDAELRKRRTHEAIKRVLVRQSLEQPFVLVFEDLHWIDEQTRELLNFLADGLATARILLLVNYRPEFTHGWGNKSYYTQLRLDPLDSANASQMLAALLGEAPELQPLTNLIADRTEGNPFFMEEMVQSLFEQGVLSRNGTVRLVKPISEVKVPPTVRGVLASRIDRLPATEKELLQTLAVIGRRFLASLVRRIVASGEQGLDQRLGELQLAEFIYEQPSLVDVEYTFKHALTQEVAYNSVLIEKRKQLHELIGTAIEELYGGRIEEHVTELAHHYGHSRNTEKAVEYSLLAGKRAVGLSANVEATRHLTRGLELLKALPDTPARTQRELTLQLAFGALSIATHGFAAPEVEQAYQRARELCKQTGDRRHIVPALVGLAHYHAMRAEHQAARELAEETYSISCKANDPELLIEAHYLQGNTLEWTGEFSAALDHLEKGIALYESRRVRAHPFLYGNDPGIACQVHAMQVLWLLGYPDQALDRARKAATIAQTLSHANSVAYALIGMAQVHHLRREWPAAEERARLCLAFASEFGLPYFIAQTSIFLGAALAGQGRFSEGIDKMREGLAAQRAKGGQGLLQYWLALQLEAYIETGRYDEGATVLAEALTIRPKHGDRYWEEEVYRLNGELLLAQAQVHSETYQGSSRAAIEGESEACFQRAIETAREQNTKSLELRATTSLSRLLRKQGKEEEARQMLAEIYGWFTEGFDTADLKDAKTLLEELS